MTVEGTTWVRMENIMREKVEKPLKQTTSAVCDQRTDTGRRATIDCEGLAELVGG